MLFMGGESQRVIFSVFSGYSSQAQCTGKPSYLEPNSQSMQKNRRRGLSATAKNEGVGSLLAFSTTKTMLKNQAYLEPNRNSLQKPIEGLPAQPPQAYL
jgi:hypothetical protein